MKSWTLKGAAASVAVGCVVLASFLLPDVEAEGDGVQTINLTIASSHSTGLPWVGVMHQLVVPESNRRLEERGSGYRIRWTEAFGGSLYKYQHTLEAVEIGLTDVGWVGTLWELSKMPLQNLTYYTPFATSDVRMLYEVMNDLNQDVPALAATWPAQNVHFLGVNSIDTYHLMTNFPVDSMDDLDGRKILAPGPAAAWLEGTGAVAVDGGLTTYYTQIQTGVADGVLTILSGALPYRIHEVAPHITLVGIGAQVTGAMAINLDTWNRLPADVQQVLDELGPEYSEGVAAEVIGRYESGLEAMIGEGAIVSELPLEEKRRWLDGLPNIALQWAEATEKRGFPAVEAVHAYMNAIRERGAQPLRNWDEPG